MSKAIAAITTTTADDDSHNTATAPWRGLLGAFLAAGAMGRAATPLAASTGFHGAASGNVAATTHPDADLIRLLAALSR